MLSTHPVAPQPIEDRLDASLQRAYDLTAQAHELDAGEIHRLGRCRDVAPLLLHALMEDGVDGLRIDSRRGWQVDEHRYVVFGEGEEETIIDGTWQQFVPTEMRTEELPKALRGTRQEVIAYAKKAGVSDTNLELWAPKGTVVEPDNRPAIERIHAHIDAHMPPTRPS